MVAPVIRVDLDGAVDEGDRLWHCRLGSEHAQPMVGVGLIGMLGDDLAIDRLGVGQTPGQMMLIAVSSIWRISSDKVGLMLL